MRVEADPSYALGHWFGLSRVPSRILAEIYTRGAGNWLSCEAVGALMRSPAVNAIRQQMWAIRQVLEAGSLDCSPGRGYCLSDQGVAECKRALLTMGAALLEVA